MATTPWWTIAHPTCVWLLFLCALSYCLSRHSLFFPIPYDLNFSANINFRPQIEPGFVMPIRARRIIEPRVDPLLSICAPSKSIRSGNRDSDYIKTFTGVSSDRILLQKFILRLLQGETFVI